SPTCVTLRPRPGSQAPNGRNIARHLRSRKSHAIASLVPPGTEQISPVRQHWELLREWYEPRRSDTKSTQSEGSTSYRSGRSVKSSFAPLRGDAQLLQLGFGTPFLVRARVGFHHHPQLTYTGRFLSQTDQGQ